MPTSFSASSSARVPLETAMASVVPTRAANSFSKASVRGPAVIHFESRASRTAADSSSLNSSSDSRAFHIALEEDMFHVGEVFIGALIIVRAANVQPVRVAFVCEHMLVVLDEAFDEIWKVELFGARDVVAHFGREHINSHAHEIIHIRFFSVLRDLAV